MSEVLLAIEDQNNNNCGGHPRTFGCIERMEKVLIFRAGALGDTILATVMALSLKKYYPKVQIDFLVSQGIEGLFPLVPWVDRAYVLRYRKIPWEIDPLKRHLLTTLDHQKYDLAVLLETHWQFARIFSRINAVQKLSVITCNNSREKSANVHTAMRYQQVLWEAGITPQEVFCPKLYVPPSEKDHALELLMGLGLDCNRSIIGLHPSNSFRQRKKVRRWIRSVDQRSWPEDRWCHLIQILHQSYPATQFVLFGSRWDRMVNDRILERIHGKEGHIQAVSSAGMTDLPLAAALMERFHLFISTDSGPIHMAAALGIPIVGLYGPTRFEETRPFCEEGLIRVLRKDLPCQPCYGTQLQKQCKDNICMKEIKVSEVMNAVEDLAILPY